MAKLSALIPVKDALQAILSDLKMKVGSCRVNLADAVGRVLYEDIVASLNVPPTDNSAMDGYAVRCANVPILGCVLPVSQRVQAGAVPQTLKVGTACRIFTGASIPLGADAVVMQENCSVDDVQGQAHIQINTEVKPRQHIRRCGQDISAGQTVLTKGTRLRPQELGLIASIGLAQVMVYEPLKVAVVSTGDELLEPGEPSQTGKIYNSNRYLLCALLRQMGMTVIDGGIVPDDLQSTQARLSGLAENADLLICSGGVSVGEADFVKTAVENLGELKLWKLAIKPGKPLAYGRVGDTPFFGLPGNPSSSFVTFLIVARPYLLRLQGMSSDVAAVKFSVCANFDWHKAGGRQEYLRAKLSINSNGQQQVDIFSKQSSGMLSSAVWADSLVVIPAGVTLKKGEYVDVIPFEGVLH